MDEAKKEKGERKTSQETSPSEPFTLDVEIEGLPYIFKGKTPKTPEDFEFTIHIPNWKEKLDNIKEKIATGELPFRLELTSFEHSQGEIAYLHAAPGKKADLYIQRVRSNTWLLKGTPYENARGLGRFLLNNLLTLADIRGWSLTAFAYTDGRLTDSDVYEWLARKGFDTDFTKGDPVRQPQNPDLSQP